jgi:hypothetical protein
LPPLKKFLLQFSIETGDFFFKKKNFKTYFRNLATQKLKKYLDFRHFKKKKKKNHQKQTMLTPDS